MRAFAITTCNFKLDKMRESMLCFLPPIVIWEWKQYPKKRVLKDSLEYQSGIY